MGTNQPSSREYSFIGVGIYTIAEASQLTRVSRWKIRRWLMGYAFKSRDAIHISPAVVPHDLALIDEHVALSFLDLVEIKFVDAFLRRGVSWKTLRLAVERGTELVGHRHPFSTGRFWTDGRTILAELAKNDAALLDVISNQLAFRRLIEPFLSQLDLEHDQAVRWWPLGRTRRVVIDPERSFGQPIVSDEGVPTAVLAKAKKVERSLARVARWYGVSKSSVRDAVRFERFLRAA